MKRYLISFALALMIWVSSVSAQIINASGACPTTIGGLNPGSLCFSTLDSTLNVYANATWQTILTQNATNDITLGTLRVTGNLTVDGTQTFTGSPTFTGQAKFADGTEAAPSITFVNDTSTGIFHSIAGNLDLSTEGTRRMFLNSVNIRFFPNSFNGRVQLSNGSSLGMAADDGTADLVLERDAAGVLAQRNGTNAQVARFYRTFTDASNYERTAIQTGAGYVELAAETAGTGTDDISVRLTPAGTGGVETAAASHYRWVGSTILTAPFDAQIRLTGNNPLATMGVVYFGGATTSPTFRIGEGTLELDNFTAGSFTSFTVQGQAVSKTLGTVINCADGSATPADCTAAPAGSVIISAGATEVVVNTTAVTADSQIIVQEDSSLGTRLSVTCNTTIARTYAVTARTAATSFTITASAAPITNPSCLHYYIVN